MHIAVNSLFFVMLFSACLGWTKRIDGFVTSIYIKTLAVLKYRAY